MEKASELLNEGAAEAADFSLLVGASSWTVSGHRMCNTAVLLNPFVAVRDAMLYSIVQQ